MKRFVRQKQEKKRKIEKSQKSQKSALSSARDVFLLRRKIDLRVPYVASVFPF